MTGTVIVCYTIARMSRYAEGLEDEVSPRLCADYPYLTVFEELLWKRRES